MYLLDYLINRFSIITISVCSEYRRKYATEDPGMQFSDISKQVVTMTMMINHHHDDEDDEMKMMMMMTKMAGVTLT